MADMNEMQIRMYSLICSNDGIKAREIARRIGVDRADINGLLYNAPFIHELCYRDENFFWHGLIRQARPHVGLGDFCGYYASVERFLQQSEEEWLEELMQGCRFIGRNLNDTRGLFHSFRDTREVMFGLFSDLETRLKRNVTPHRLERKPSKRDVEWSTKDILKTHEKYRLNSYDDEFICDSHIKIDNTDLSPEEVADLIVQKYGLSKIKCKRK